MSEFEYEKHPLFHLGMTMTGDEELGSLNLKLYLVNWFFCMIDTDGLNGWAQAGSENTLYIRDCLKEAGVPDFVEIFDAWINAIPGGLTQIDVDYCVVRTPTCNALDAEAETLFRYDGGRLADRYLEWYRDQQATLDHS